MTKEELIGRNDVSIRGIRHPYLTRNALNYSQVSDDLLREDETCQKNEAITSGKKINQYINMEAFGHAKILVEFGN